MSRRSCFYCQSTPATVPGLILHKFPTEVSRRNIWLKLCGYSNDDYLPSRAICSLHFEDDSYRVTNKKLLKSCAIPTKFKKLSKTTWSSVVKSKMSSQSLEENSCELSCSTTNVLQHNLKTSKRRKRKCFIGDITTSDLSTPEQAKIYFKMAKLKMVQQRRKIKTLTQQVNRQKKKILMLNSLLDNSETNNSLSEEAHDNILIII
ncbi:Hypothetical protein CINCED_3A023079 [Cinara cedri]|uniref:THAP-type domain-containing protein n=1 Tax=Cinara cedri TaxID=506608 RepID=A0A5E4NAU7_9HEMI|nr:Hypothetical protein CINCED_3A023079 [Cinara cedri]